MDCSSAGLGWFPISLDTLLTFRQVTFFFHYILGISDIDPWVTSYPGVHRRHLLIGIDPALLCRLWDQKRTEISELKILCRGQPLGAHHFWTQKRTEISESFQKFCVVDTRHFWRLNYCGGRSAIFGYIRENPPNRVPLLFVSVLSGIASLRPRRQTTDRTPIESKRFFRQ